MADLNLFIDGSVDPVTRIGVGAYLVVDASEAELPTDSDIALIRFENTSSTKLELQTLLAALDRIRLEGDKLTIITDSQTIAHLPNRRNRLEASDFQTKRGTRIRNFELYHQFFASIDRRGFQIMKVKGHSPQKGKSVLERIFTLVDRAARKALRHERG